MTGFYDSISNNQHFVHANNADFSGIEPHLESHGIQTNGQLWIGTTALNAGGTHITVGNITGSGGVTVTNGPGTINISLGGGGLAIDTIKGNDGVAEVPDGSGVFNFLTSNTTAKFAGSANTETLDFGLTNLLLGNSGTSITSATGNVGIGPTALTAITSGSSNVAIGFNAAQNMNTGVNNVIIGVGAGISMTSASKCVAIGVGSLQTATTGVNSNNIAIGYTALNNITTGASNIALGVSAGTSYTGTESSNICIGNTGTVAESNTIRIGTAGSGGGQQNKAFVAGVTGVTVAASAPVGVDTNGQLSSLGFGTSGQLLQSTGAASSPAWTTLPSAITWSKITADQTAAVNNGYICNKAGLLTLTMPSTSAIGDTIAIININTAAGAKFLSANPGQLQMGTSVATANTGSISSTALGDVLYLTCTTANTTWYAYSSQGNWTVA